MKLLGRDVKVAERVGFSFDNDTSSRELLVLELGFVQTTAGVVALLPECRERIVQLPGPFATRRRRTPIVVTFWQPLRRYWWLKHIEILGAILGFVVGLVQVLILVIFSPS